MSDNSLAQAPGWAPLAALRALRQLRLRGCSLSFLPNRLSGLTHLDVSHNPIDWPAGWAALGAMPALRRLTASRPPAGLDLLTAAEVVHGSAQAEEEAEEEEVDGWMQ